MKALLAAARGALQWRLLLLWLGALLLPAVLAALPVWLILTGELDRSVHVAALTRELDLLALADLGTALRRDSHALTTGGIGAVALTLLLSPLLTGAVVTAARAPSVPRFGALFTGACTLYPRMLRLLAWGLLPLGAMALLGMALADAALEHGKTALLYRDAHRWQVAAAGAAVVLMLLANLSLDLGRAVLAIDRRQTRAVRAWWHGLRLLGRRPGGVLLAWLVPTAAGLALAALLGAARLHVPALDDGGTVGALVLGQFVVLAIGWLRTARLFALIALARLDAGPLHLH